MKTLRLATLSLAVAALLPSLTSCRSDESPFGWTITQQKADAIIQLRLNVAETRATNDESAISKLTVLVFDDSNTLEVAESFDLGEDEKSVSLDVSHGLKTIYVVAGKKAFYGVENAKISDFENYVFDSTLANLKGGDGFLMIGKSEKKQVMISSSKDDIPASNVFSISLQRLIAKAQVKSVNVDGSAFGITFGNASFKAFQLNKYMRVVANGTDVQPSTTHANGTYDNYFLEGEDYLSAVLEFTAEGCAYMPENIVTTPVSGNTTFLGIRFSTSPEKYYSYDTTDKSLKEAAENPAASSDYYAVGVQDKSAGIVDYVVVPGSKKIATFKTQEDAAAYAASLNGGEASAATVSQTDAPLMAPSLTRAAGSFEVIKFDKGNVYYRVNVTHTEGSESNLKVLRNRFYKVNINSVSTLGFGSDELLRPTNPDSGFETSSKSWISVAISVDDWVDVPQDANL